jgi:hypothetical protein
MNNGLELIQYINKSTLIHCQTLPSPIVFPIFHFIRPIYVFTQNSMLLACLELEDFGGVVVIVIVIVTGGKQSQLLEFWTWIGLEFDNKLVPWLYHSVPMIGQ